MSKPLPKLDLNVTNRCNFRCIHCCFNSGETMLPEFSLDKIKNILKEFKTLGGERIDITGGEPLLRPDLPKIIKIGKDLNLKIELVTNSSLLTDEKLKLFKQLGLDAIAISLDGSDYQTYKKIRPIKQNIYKLIIENIQKCVNYGFPVKINTVVFNSNLDDLAKINELAIKWGAKEHGFYYFTPVGRGAKSSTEVVDPMRWLTYIRQTLLKSKDKIKLSLENPLLDSNLTKDADTSCYLKNPWHLQILPD
ncbi:MAG: radical SAM protein, partial [Patescibacteria group bacterium]